MARTTRWEDVPNRGYGPKFGELIREGVDVDGEARLADALITRHSTVLDAGSGMGRVAAALVARGHRVTAVEKDPGLVKQSAATFPELGVITADLIDLSPGFMSEVGQPTSYDLVVMVGNVIVYLAPDSEIEVLSGLESLMAPNGRMLVGFNPKHGPNGARDYAPDEFEADAAAAGLVIEHRFGTYELHPASEEYCVYVLAARRAGIPG